MNTMRAVTYDRPEHFTLTTSPVPDPAPGQVLLKVLAAGVCGTDLHLHVGDFGPTYPLVPGHEFVGEVLAVGAGVPDDLRGHWVVVDNTASCGRCPECRRARPAHCRNLVAQGVNAPGGFDVVIDATGSAAVLARTVGLTRTGGTIFVYGMTPQPAQWPLSPYEIFRRELTIRGSFAQQFSFDRALTALRSGRVDGTGLVTRTFGLDQYQQALAAVADSTVVKAALVP